MPTITLNLLEQRVRRLTAGLSALLGSSTPLVASGAGSAGTDAFGSHQDHVHPEQASTAADVVNAAAIAAEAVTRAVADSTLTSAISSEATTRASADTTLTTAISSEATARASADTALTTAVGTKVTANPAIVGAQKTKITYDANGLVTSGADAAFTDITGTITDTQHGSRGGGALHADVVAGGASGFMNGTQATKLAGVATGATAEVDAAHGVSGRVNQSAQKLGDGTKTVDALISTGQVEAQSVLLDASTPSAPSAGVTVHAKAGAVSLPHFRITGSAKSRMMQPIFGTVRVMYPRTTDVFGLAATNSNATNTGVTVDGTNFRTSISRATQTSSAGAGSTVSFGMTTNAAASGAWWLGNAAGLGGFYCYIRFAFSTIPATRRWACGFRKVNSDPGSTNINPSAAVNWFGIGCDSGDTNVQFMHNDASGTATKSSTGIAMPTTSEVIECQLYSAPNSGTVQMSYESLNGGSSLVSYSATSDLPSNTTFFMPFIAANNATTASPIAFDSMTVYIDSDY